MRRLFGHKDDSDAGGAATAIIPGHKRYKMKERMFSFGDDYYIEDEEGHRAFKVDGKMLRLRSTLTIRDAEGHEVAKIQEKWLRVKDSMEIEGPNGERIAMVKKALYTPVRQRFTVNITDGPDLDADGNIVNHEYEIKRDGFTAAVVSKKWFRVRDIYGVEIVPGIDPVIILSVVACIDQLAHD